MGFVVLAGLWEPGTVVELFQVSHEGVVRVDGSEPEVGRRIADSNGSVGFDGVQVGARFIARGQLDGRPLEVRALGLSVLDTELSQEPVRATPQPVGTQEEVPVPDPVGEPGSILHVGVPASILGGGSTT